MIRSMTGYGKGEVDHDTTRLAVEVWSVNHRYLDVSVRLPRPLAALEHRVRGRVQDALTRGKVTLTLTWDVGGDDAEARLELNASRVERYLTLADELRERHGAVGELDVRSLLTLPDVVTDREPAHDADDWWEPASRAVDAAVAALLDLKTSEGEAIGRDMRARLDVIDELAGEVERRAPGRVTELRDRLRQRIAELAQNGEVDDYRMEQEIAHHAERLDVTEECVRLRSHLEHFRSFADEDEAAGRKLNFLLQEMNREATTIGSKANDADLSMLSVRMKEEIERIREQVQNVE